MNWFAIEYETAADGSITCSDYNNVKQGPLPNTFTALCDRETMKAIVQVYAAGDNKFASSNVGEPYNGTTECYLPPEESVLVSKYEIACSITCDDDDYEPFELQQEEESATTSATVEPTSLPTTVPPSKDTTESPTTNSPTESPSTG